MKNKTVLTGTAGVILLAGMVLAACASSSRTTEEEIKEMLARAGYTERTEAAQSEPAAAPVSQAKRELQDMYLSYLRSEGYNSPKIDSDGDIQFTVSGSDYYYYIIVDEDDTEYFRMYTVRNLSSAQKRKANAAANYASRLTKVARVYISSSGERATIETGIFVNRLEDFKSVFSRMVSALKAAEKNFTEEAGS